LDGDRLEIEAVFAIKDVVPEDDRSKGHCEDIYMYHKWKGEVR
jgi:hypothetical protein